MIELLAIGVPVVVDNVNVAVFEVALVMVTVAASKDAATPAGSGSVAVKLTAPVKPASGVIVIVY